MRTYSWLGRKWDDLALRRKTFENFDARRQPEAFEAARLFAEFPSGSLVLYGTFGTGKTHLLAAVCNCTLLQSAPTTSLFTTAPKFFTAIHELHRYGESFRRLIDYAIATPLLVIDDIDKANYNEFHEQIYFEIVDARINAARPTAISTNRLADLANYVGGAVCSRLRIGQIAVRMVGKDYREEL